MATKIVLINHPGDEPVKDHFESYENYVKVHAAWGILYHEFSKQWELLDAEISRLTDEFQLGKTVDELKEIERQKNYLIVIKNNARNGFIAPGQTLELPVPPPPNEIINERFTLTAKPKQVLMTFQVDQELKTRFEKICAAKGKTVSAALRELMQAATS